MKGRISPRLREIINNSESTQEVLSKINNNYSSLGEELRSKAGSRLQEYVGMLKHRFELSSGEMVEILKEITTLEEIFGE